MKYTYNLGPWREWRGYVFCNFQPTEIVDRAALELIKREEGFTPYEVKPQEVIHGEEVKETPAEARVLENPYLSDADKQAIEKPKFNRSEWMKKMHAEGRMKKK